MIRVPAVVAKNAQSAAMGCLKFWLRRVKRSHCLSYFHLFRPLDTLSAVCRAAIVVDISHSTGEAGENKLAG